MAEPTPPRGPRVTFALSCEGCEYLVREPRGTAYGCTHPVVVELNDGSPGLVGIGDTETPTFCPLRRAAIARAIDEGPLTRREIAWLAARLQVGAGERNRVNLCPAWTGPSIPTGHWSSGHSIPCPNDGQSCALFAGHEEDHRTMAMLRKLGGMSGAAGEENSDG